MDADQHGSTLAVVLVAALLLSACGREAVVPEGPNSPGRATDVRVAGSKDVRYPSIEPANAEGMTPCPLLFRFEGREFRISVPVQQSVLLGARGARRTAQYVEGRRPHDLESRLHLAFVQDPSLDAFYESVLECLRPLKRQLELDSNGYLELIAAVVQHIPYEEGTEKTRFPIEVVADNAGDCDEKCHLLAGLLAREGFSVALLSFDADDHMALGVRADGLEFRSTGYMMVETTSPMLPGGVMVGTPSRSLRGGDFVIPVADGPLSYTATSDLLFIQSSLADLRARQDAMAKELEVESAVCEELARQIRSADLEVQRLRGSGSPKVPAEVARRNELVRRHNAAVDVQRSLVEDHNRIVDVLNRTRSLAAARRPLAAMLRDAMKD